MRPSRLSLLILFALSSLAIAQEADVVPAYAAEEVAKLTDEQLLAIALADMKDDAAAADLEYCVDVGFLDPACGGSLTDGGDVVQSEPVCIPPEEEWLPDSCAELFAPARYVGLTLAGRWGFFKICLSGDTHEGDTCDLNY